MRESRLGFQPGYSPWCSASKEPRKNAASTLSAMACSSETGDHQHEQQDGADAHEPDVQAEGHDEEQGQERTASQYDGQGPRPGEQLPHQKLMDGFDYFLKIPHRKFRDVNGYYNDSTELKVTLPKDEKLSSISLEMSHVKNRYIVDLLSEKRDKVIRSFTVDADQTVLFPYVKAGKYCLRLTEDRNKNGLVDTGSILEHRQPEKVMFFKIKDQFLLDIPERTEYVQKIDMEELFR